MARLSQTFLSQTFLSRAFLSQTLKQFAVGGLLGASVLWVGLTVAPSEASAASAYQVEVVETEVDYPWSLAFLPDGSLLVAQLNGQLRLIKDGALVEAPIAGVPEVFFEGQGGLFDVVLHPDFAENHLVYLSFAAGTAASNGTRVVRGRFDGTALQDVEMIYDMPRKKDTAVHYGGRIAFDQDNHLFLTLGDGFDYREEAQNLSNPLGSLVRLDDDGSVPVGNPFVGQEGKQPEIWSYGHRNPQGLLVAANGQVFLHEHGPQGGDEINLIEPGQNYGWPIATYGIDYSGAAITPYQEYEGTVQPIKYWVPSIAPSGFALYEASLFPEWQGDFFVGGLVPGDLRRIEMEDGKVVGEEILLTEIGARVRDVRVAPDGSLYVLTDGEDGQILRLVPAKE